MQKLVLNPRVIVAGLVLIGAAVYGASVGDHKQCDTPGKPTGKTYSSGPCAGWPIRHSPTSSTTVTVTHSATASK